MAGNDAAILVYLTPEEECSANDADKFGFWTQLRAFENTVMYGPKVSPTRRGRFITVSVPVLSKCDVDTGSFGATESAKCCAIDEGFNAAWKALALPEGAERHAQCPTEAGNRPCKSCRADTAVRQERPKAK